MRKEVTDNEILMSINKNIEKINGNTRALLLTNTIMTLLLMIVTGILILSFIE